MAQSNDKPRAHFDIGYFLFALTAILVLQQLLETYTRTDVVAYSEFYDMLREGKIAEVEVGDKAVRATLKKPMADGRKDVIAVRVDPNFAQELEAAKVKYTGAVEHTWISMILSWILPATIFFLIWSYFSRRLGQGLGSIMSVGQSKAKIFIEKDIKIGFRDVAGVDEAKEELQEIVAFLKDPATYGRLGAHVPKGILLVGPPGTGKTLLARAVAGEAAVPFFSINGSEFVEMFVGVGAARVRDLFAQARATAPCIIFIDELDALGRARGISGLSGGHDEKEQTLNQLLSELDGFDPTIGVVLLAATNRPEVLDPALLRAGRFDRQISVDRPDKNGRVAILQVHLAKIKLASDVDAGQIAAMTPGFTGADIANLVNEAAMLATRRKAESVSAADFTAAIERVLAGPEKRKRILNPRERRIVAYHEMGHAIVAMALPDVDPIKKVSIIPRGLGALGYTMQMPTEDRYLMTRTELLHRMTVLLGGRAAEMLVFQEATTGAADDLQRATEMARAMVTRYGMEEEIGRASFVVERPRYLDLQGLGPQQSDMSDETSARIDEAIGRLVEEAFERATDVLSACASVHRESAERLLETETFGEEDLAALSARVKAVVLTQGPAHVGAGHATE
ncbi:ATP-dependent zinc metalloprotease FtsH [Methylocystis sp. MJC1]|jgi:cell division protease FtsH|uniref:ATP-dependent zinc metalloprotease FtsH n=1 Tax=Methylocystis sp. MJC1 TaxID=2654282 RepID=UPI0013ECA4CE|nr:ATP-dependent zinc metalloprotease FtsH [Methylocystis sp. MJC1]KAF2989899.1 ATP-dependent zinc metalloprotease FtsH 4 [Methylocystis sp. MJC1]MBU6528332.1 ATP-dependent zinc metalloprotease FtsH [Methylocystis sp. MJC1]UZX11237.1 ATP-dependent zinc metalloprotease FtsH [Methylocystis sp. MJC1]